MKGEEQSTINYSEIMKNILVVDDEQDLCEILQFNLENEGYTVSTANSSEEALKIIEGKPFDLLLLDVMMGGMSGYQLARLLRIEHKNMVPIIFLTAKNTENDMLTGFSIGGDDYIAKPFSIKEVLARIKAVLGRAAVSSIQPEENLDIISENLRIDLKAKNVTVDNIPVELTKKEFLILCMLIQSKHEYFTREQILDRVWKDESCVLERTVDVHIARLRKKLGSWGYHIVSRQGFGYCFKP